MVGNPPLVYGIIVVYPYHMGSETQNTWFKCLIRTLGGRCVSMFIYFYFMCMGALLVCKPCACLGSAEAREGVRELQTIENHHMVAGKGTQVLWKSSQCS